MEALFVTVTFRLTANLRIAKLRSSFLIFLHIHVARDLRALHDYCYRAIVVMSGLFKCKEKAVSIRRVVLPLVGSRRCRCKRVLVAGVVNGQRLQ